MESFGRLGAQQLYSWSLVHQHRPYSAFLYRHGWLSMYRCPQQRSCTAQHYSGRCRRNCQIVQHYSALKLVGGREEIQPSSLHNQIKKTNKFFDQLWSFGTGCLDLKRSSFCRNRRELFILDSIERFNSIGTQK